MNFDLENPIDFMPERKHGEYLISYKNMREIAQGSPIIGNICINESCLPESLFFGGPFLFQFEKIIIPLFIRKFCVAGFRLCVVDLKTLNYELYGRIKGLIFLDSVKNNEVYFFITLDKLKQESIVIL